MGGLLRAGTWGGEEGRPGRGTERRRGEVRIRVSTLVVHPMQDTARHDPRSPRRVNCPARYRAARRGTLYARERRIVYTVPYRWSYCSPRRCPYMQPVAYQCARLYLPRQATTWISLPPPPPSHLWLLFVILSLRRSFSLVPSRFLPPCIGYELKGRVCERVNCAILG